MAAVDILPIISTGLYAAVGFYAFVRLEHAETEKEWLLLPFALVVAACERAVHIYALPPGGTFDTGDLWAEAAAFVASVLLTAGAFVVVHRIVALQAAVSEVEERLERFRDYTELAADWYWEMDAEERITYLSERVTQVTGMPPEFFIGKKREEFTSDTVAGDDWMAYRRSIDARRPFRDFVYCWKDLDGRTRWLSINGKPVFDDSGMFVGYRGTAHDETDLREVDAARRGQEALLDSIVENIPTMLFVKDAVDLRYVLINKAGENMLGMSRKEIIGRTAYDLYPEEMASGFTEQDRAVIDGSGFMDIPDEAVETASKGTCRMRTRKVALYGEDGKPRYLVGIAEDITDRLRAERELRDSKDAAEVANRAKSDFLAKMSHELRTPLNAIIGFSEMMKDEILGPHGNDSYIAYASDIHTSGIFLLELISDLLDLSRIEAGEMNLDMSDVDIVDVLDGCVSALAPKIAEKSLSVEWSRQGGPYRLRGDRMRLRQIFNNLLSNAIKFTPAGGRVTIGVNNENAAAIKVSVVDNGIGIPEAEQESIFDPFHQVDDVSTRRSDGVGLGLSITRTLVKMHGGQIELESKPGEGTAVAVTLPLDPTGVSRPADAGAHSRVIP